jgi:hypothetical protein
LSRSEFCVALKIGGYLTAPEAIAAAKGEIPGPLSVALAASVATSAMTQDEADAAEILWAGLTQVERLHPIIGLVQTAESLTDAQVDALFGIS